MSKANTQKLSKRQEQTRAERRQRRSVRGAFNYDGRLKLGVDPELKDDRFEYRWVNDEGGRLQQKFDQDWDPVTQDMLNEGKRKKENTDDDVRDEEDIAYDNISDIPMDQVIRRPVGPGRDGAPVTAVLCRKSRNWYESDRADMYKDIAETDRKIRVGAPQGDESGALTGDKSYVPDNGNAIKITRPNA